MVPEEIYCGNRRTAEYAVLQQVLMLMYDIAIITKGPLLEWHRLMLDAAQCYDDRVALSMPVSLYKCSKAPKPKALSMLCPLHNNNIDFSLLCAGFGQSSSYFGFGGKEGGKHSLAQGLAPGNGAACSPSDVATGKHSNPLMPTRRTDMVWKLCARYQYHIKKINSLRRWYKLMGRS